MRAKLRDPLERPRVAVLMSSALGLDTHGGQAPKEQKRLRRARRPDVVPQGADDARAKQLAADHLVDQTPELLGA